ncbi:VWA domain containing CoxE-like protein [Acididesulfobacillus acetoxydans]|uniref:Protein containing von Willebrand factor type A (VWA) domain n=1 Tax=Acididesulfobacillus acetoxydans TaxID=1561005 RepID=A0A8S0XXP9_9FIRM|nr:VWA domain-containing protein [Acididesulfobacillus acetoxydans]CAA7601897.1 VWA domain containing CoxE-like protein [Acididesulfobacillus acetoxydans]CEJ08259.1 Protein containing von Willebrand factor type A (VWA) domain [Acididesulfobacillus acetoxydans]
MDGWHFLVFTSALRYVVPVSTQDLGEALKALRRFPHLPEKQVLRATLIHRPQEMNAFELVWQAVFNRAPLAEERKGNPGSAPAQASGPGELGQGRGSGGVSLQAGRPSFAKVRALLAGWDRTVPEVALEETVRQLLGEAGAHTWLNAQELAFSRGQTTADDFEEARNHLESLAEALRRELKIRNIELDNSWESLHRESWQHKPLLGLTAEERSLVQTAIRQWGRRLAVRPGWRFSPTRRGALDLRATVREASRNDGRAFHLHYRRRLPRIPELVVLCDVSNSVAPYAEFLLFLVARLRANFRRVRLFFFIDTLWDVPAEIWDDDLQDLSPAIQSWSGKASSGFSDYGRVFRQLAENVLPEISALSTLLILGDGRNNFRPAQAEYLAEIEQNVRSILWLNPLNPEEWLARDNALPSYRPYCRAVYRCRTVQDLHLIAGALLR